MSKPPHLLTVEQVRAIHQRVVREFGGSGELRDRGLLESAAAVPSAKFAGEFLHADMAAMAGAYLFHLCRNHPFVDGNKRVAAAAAEVFLTVNGQKLGATNDELFQLTLGVAAGSVSKDEAVEFFRQRITDGGGE